MDNVITFADCPRCDTAVDEDDLNLACTDGGQGLCIPCHEAVCGDRTCFEGDVDDRDD